MTPDCLILEIHFVGDYSKAPVQLPAVLPETLSRLIDFLMIDREPIRLNQIIAQLDGKKNGLPERSFYLTFDDGIRDHATHVLDILRRCGLEAAFFVPGSVFAPDGRLPLLERQRFLQYAFESYDDFLARFISAAALAMGAKETALMPNTANLARMGGYLAHFSFYSTAERYYRFIRDTIIPPAEFASAINLLFAERFTDELALLKTYYMSPEDLRRISDAGMVVGCHGYSHEHLPRLPDQKADIQAGLQVLGDIIGHRPRTMAYPYGSFDDTTISLMDPMGFQIAFISGNRTAHIQPGDRWKIPRMDIADVLVDAGLTKR